MKLLLTEIKIPSCTINLCEYDTEIFCFKLYLKGVMISYLYIYLFLRMNNPFVLFLNLL